MKKPNFFIAGAPKCGTTAMYSYLSTHPHIYLSRPKEPNYFCDDFNDTIRRFRTEQQYFSDCFQGVNENHDIVGEGSVLYLYSSQALPKIKEFNPDSKILVMLRNPVDMVLSWHRHLVYWRYEDKIDFEKAWRLQYARQSGTHIPKLCPDPSLLQYKKVCSLGAQLKRANAVFPSSQILAVRLESFIESPRNVYREVLAFLNLPDDGREEFPPVNQAKTHKSRLLADTIAVLEKLKRKQQVFHSVKSRLGVQRIGVLGRIKKLNTKSSHPSTPIEPEFEQELISEFHEDSVVLKSYLTD